MRLILLLGIALAVYTSNIVAASDFPPFCEPTGIDRDFLGGERVDFAIRAADQLQAAGFARDAQRVRGAFVLWRQPMHQLLRIDNGSGEPSNGRRDSVTKPGMPK